MQQTPDDIDIDLRSKNGIQGMGCGIWNAKCGKQRTSVEQMAEVRKEKEQVFHHSKWLIEAEGRKKQCNFRKL